MSSTLVQLLPLALGVIASPLPVMAVVLLLLGDRPRSTGLAFVGGWIAGLAALGLVGILVFNGTSIFGSQGDGPVARAVTVILGVVLLVLAVLQWRDRPRDGADGELPKWMTALTTFSPAKAFGLAATFAAVKPKNLVLTLAAATTISESGMAIGPELVALVVFVGVASTGVATPLVVYFALGSRASVTLQRWGDWLTRNNAVVVAVVLLVLGLLLVASSLRP